MSSATSASPLADYLAGRLSAEQLVAAVTAEYYRERGNGKREALRPILEIVERAHPGVVELKSSEQRPGFEVRLAGRPFPKRYETELRQAVQAVVDGLPVSAQPVVGGPATPSLFRRLVSVIRRVLRISPT